MKWDTSISGARGWLGRAKCLQMIIQSKLASQNFNNNIITYEYQNIVSWSTFTIDRNKYTYGLSTRMD